MSDHDISILFFQTIAFGVYSGFVMALLELVWRDVFGKGKKGRGMTNKTGVEN